ncbi:hypothetical protein J4221_03600 [Candidatus Pacearchaeota archaeon]|nr:hypothetical protein [Candidatus Pacearchaeota archaeon]
MNRRYEIRPEVKNVGQGIERVCYFVYEIDYSDPNKTQERVIDGAVIRKKPHLGFVFALYKTLGSENYGRMLDNGDLQAILEFKRSQNPDSNQNNPYRNFPFFNTKDMAMKAANDYAEYAMKQLEIKQELVSKVESSYREKESKERKKFEALLA